jgi:glycosyltransferase involved in cell wall biosynthesis
MKISVITPSFNQANFLPVCLNSVIGQTYTNIEHIVVDGCSTDNSVAILNSFQKKDDRIIFTSEEDSGQGNAVNKGFARSNGDIIAWINSDDFYFDNEIFEFVAEFFKSNQDIDIIYGGMAYVDEDNNLNHVRIPPKYRYSLLTRISYIGNTNCFYRRRVIEQHNLDESYHFVIDHEYMLRITKDFKAYRINRMVACFRVHSKAKTQVLSKEVKDIERNKRDKYHNIQSGYVFKFIQFYDRAIYRLNLLYSNLRFLRRYRRLVPYKIFLKD